MSPKSLIIGAGAGLSASLARTLAKRGHRVILAARDTSGLSDLAEATGAVLVDCDARDRVAMAELFEKVDAMNGALELAIYNPSARVRGPINEVDPEAVEQAILVSAYGAFLMAHHASQRMLTSGRGTMLFTGASAGVKGFANSAAFAIGKFGLRGLCQSLARELHPQNIHIGHIVIDGGIAKSAKSGRENETGSADNMLDPDRIAQSYMHLLDQHRSSWSWEIELRPWVERF